MTSAEADRQGKLRRDRASQHPNELAHAHFTIRAVFLGRISPEKGPDRAIRIARTLGIPLKIAAKVDKADEAYFREKIARV
jgi:glycosyltransferase involved in cell wall biosynthesis